MEKKYELTEETKEFYGRTLYRIKALKDFGDVEVGDLGGYIESESNLIQECCAWVYGNAMVYGDAKVYGNANVCGDAEIKGKTDYIVFKNWWSSGRYFTWTHSNNMWKVGCFYGTGKELVEKAYKDSELSGREYERAVKYVESILADEKKQRKQLKSYMLKQKKK